MATTNQKDQSDSLELFLWQNRIILVDTDKVPEQDALEQLRLAKDDIDERQVIWFLVGGETVHSNWQSPVSGAMRVRLQGRFATSSKSVLLIGKDGGVKMRSSQLQLQKILDRIDSMPMRQNEMRQNKAR